MDILIEELIKIFRYERKGNSKEIELILECNNIYLVELNIIK